MKIVLDASAAIEIVLNKLDASEFSEIISKAEIVIAPELFISEISNVAWKYYKLANFSEQQAVELANNSMQLIDYTVPAETIWQESLGLAMSNNQAVYDCLYLVCARRNNAVLISKDKRLKALCKKLEVKYL